MVHITYQYNPTFDLAHVDFRLLKEVHYYISNENGHDTLFVQHVLKLN